MRDQQNPKILKKQRHHDQCSQPRLSPLLHFQPLMFSTPLWIPTNYNPNQNALKHTQKFNFSNRNTEILKTLIDWLCSSFKNAWFQFYFFLLLFFYSLLEITWHNEVFLGVSGEVLSLSPISSWWFDSWTSPMSLL